VDGRLIVAVDLGPSGCKCALVMLEGTVWGRLHPATAAAGQR